MVCPKCNSQYADNLAACPFCSVTEQPAAQAPVQNTPFQVPQGAAEFAPPAPVKKKSKAGIIIPIVVAVIVAVLGIASFVINNKEATHTMILEESEDGFDTVDEFTFFCKGDRVYKIEETVKFTYDDEYEDYMAEIADSIENDCEDAYGDYEFVDITYETEGTTITIKFVYNDIEEHMDEYIEMELIEEGADYLSYSQSVDNMEDDGYVLVEE